MITPKTFTRSKISKGFTLIELMIGIAIIGVLSAIAIPAFQDYLNRSKVTELINLAQACKTGIVEFAASTSKWPTNGAQAGCQTGTGTAISSKYADNLIVRNNGVIEVSFKAKEVADSIVDGHYIRLRPVLANGTTNQTDATQPISQWRCLTNVGVENYRYLPATCRNNG
ncbi:pilin [uncultured Limnobacter sp.]|jgi:type IV pilus assembly protein PilA|uniref:pilin n=1 Tax=uncultured Limnobacter sp. TaxID=199681 RepID=UPI0030FAD4FB